ncbi:Nitrogen permease regulator 2 [Phlyctochytrium planicorne]|nr:Nitrogen permease regulator 2 [Phlyctochytrium planicorne]
MSSKGNQVVDEETLAFLNEARDLDYTIIAGVNLDRRDIEFKHTHAERLSNFRTDEIYLERSFEAEAEFLEMLIKEERDNFLSRQVEEAHEQLSIESDRTTFGQIMSEMKDLKLLSLQNKAAADIRKSSKKSLKQRRLAIRDKLSRLEIRQERERRSLGEAHSRYLRDLKLTRHLVLKEVEDPELRLIISGKQVNERTLAADSAKAKADHSEAIRLFNAKVVSLLVRNTKEIEQLREAHLLNMKHTSKICDTELEAIDEFEAMVADHSLAEQRLEAELKSLADREEENLRTAMVAAKAKADHANSANEAAVNIAKKKSEAKSLKRQLKTESIQREKEFWENEEALLREHLIATKQETDDKGFLTKAAVLLDRSRFTFAKKLEEIEAAKALDQDDSSDSAEANEADSKLVESAAKAAAEAMDDEKKFARELYRIENLRKVYADQVQKLKNQNKKIRAALKRSHDKLLENLKQEQEKEFEALREKQEEELEAVKQSQKSFDKGETDDKETTINASLPTYVVDSLRAKQSVDPRKFDQLVFLSCEIDQFSSLSELSAVDLVSFLNRLYAKWDNVIQLFDDVHRLEAFGEGYVLVAGLNSAGKSARHNAIDLIECASSFIQVAQNLDISETRKGGVDVSIGIHYGSGVAIVTNAETAPKFSILGEGINVTNVIQQTSRGGQVHISAAVHELIKNDYECEVSESVPYPGVSSEKGSKKKIATFWVSDKLGAPVARGRKFSIEAPTALPEKKPLGSANSLNKIKGVGFNDVVSSIDSMRAASRGSRSSVFSQ